MKILFCSSEVHPYSKTGGLADMASFLPKGLVKHNYEVIVITPYYQQITKYHEKMKYVGTSNIKIGGIETVVHYFEIFENNIRYIFVQNQHYYERERLYGYNDDAERFTLFSFAILDAISVLNLDIDIIHINDWQSAIVPYLLDEHYRHRGENYFKIHTLLTIHNLQHQGSFDPYVSRFFNHSFDYTYIHFDSVNFLKTGIMRSTLINTVSPTYRNEVLTPEYGFSLDGALKQRENDFYGILNGIDILEFDPSVDTLIEKNYNRRNYLSGKRENKIAFLTKLGLEYNEKKPLLAFVSRLADQKGLDILNDVLEEIINYSDAQFFFLGTGEQKYEDHLIYLHHKYPKQFYYYHGFNEKIAREAYAASDLFLMPSKFEPCGLGQMIAMRYGSLPIVRETGGLKDTVTPFNKYSSEGSGFTFFDYNSYVLKEKIFEAISLYEKNQSTFRKLIREAMNKDYTNEVMTKNYIKLYKKIMGV